LHTKNLKFAICFVGLLLFRIWQKHFSDLHLKGVATIKMGLCAGLGVKGHQLETTTIFALSLSLSVHLNNVSVCK